MSGSHESISALSPGRSELLQVNEFMKSEVVAILGKLNLVELAEE
jgi:hypothetical protein